MDTDKVAEALDLIDRVLAKVACTREDHKILVDAVNTISDAAFGICADEE